MASIDDVYNQLIQVNAELVQLHTDLGQVNTNLTTGFGNVVTATNHVVTATNQVNSTLTSGFAGLENGIGQLITLAQYEDLALSHISKQDDTIICLLDKIGKLLCALLNQSALQTGLQTGILETDTNLTDMYASVNSAAALDLERRAQLQQEITKCCPPPPPEPVCTFEPCDAPPPLPDPPNQKGTSGDNPKSS